MHHELHSEVMKGSLKRKAFDNESSEFEPVKILKKNKHCRASKAKWTQEEDEELTRAVVINGEGNWKKIAQSLNDRSHLQCLHRWQKVLNPALVKGPWKEEEDSKLVELVEKYGAKDWSSIASHIPGRIGKQCRERWFNHLSPEVRKTNWSSEEDRIIIEAHHRLGNKWTAISKLLDGRPANAIKNHWNSTLLKRIQDETGENPTRRDRKKIKILSAVQATDDSESSDAMSSECSSPESPRYGSSSMFFAPLPIPPQPQYIATPSFISQPTSDIPQYNVMHQPQLIHSPRMVHPPVLNSFAPFGDGPLTWDWAAQQQQQQHQQQQHHGMGLVHVNSMPVVTQQQMNAMIYNNNCGQVLTEAYPFTVPQPVSELVYCIDQQGSDIRSSSDGLSSPDEVHHNVGFYNGEMEMPSLFTM